MKIYLQDNVYEAAKKRISYIFDEFETVVVGYSSGKDSTVILNLAFEVMKEKGITKKLPVVFVDQEAEWTETVKLVRDIMSDPRVEPLWFQMPIKISNNASHTENWLQCWEEGADWIRPKEEISIKENIYGTDRFADLFPAILKTIYKGEKACYLAGVRAEESPGRLAGLTSSEVYKGLTFGKTLTKDQYTFYPIYDWSYTDVWAYIHKNKLRYNKIYDLQFKKGVGITKMRVSNVHHETAVHSLFNLQEFDKELYEALTKRIGGIDTAGKMGVDNFFRLTLPRMFSNWVEYRDFLFEKLLTDEQTKKTMKYFIYKFDHIFKDDQENLEKSAKKVVQSIICNDITGTKLKNYYGTFVNYYKRDNNIKLKKYDRKKDTKYNV